MKLEAAYPECIEQSTKSPNGFAPHLTIAKFTIGGDNSKENVAKLITEWKSAFMTDPLELEIANEQAAVLFEIETLCTTAIGEGSVSVHLAGSTLMRFHDDASDIDILVCGPQEISHQVYFEALGAVHNSASQNERNKLELVSIVLDILIPIGRFRMGSVEIDLVYCRCGASNWENVSEKDLRGQSENYVRSLDGVMEADAIFGLIPKVWWPTYATSVHALKFWAKRRQIYSSVMGYLSSNTISLLLAKVILQTGIPSKPSTAEELFYWIFWLLFILEMANTSHLRPSIAISNQNSTTDANLFSIFPPFK